MRPVRQIIKESMKKKLASAVIGASISLNALAGGINTNTNQNAEYLRNPARDAAIAIDGTYSNPAGVAMLDSGLHVSFSIQSAIQERNITSTFDPFQYGKDNNGATTKTFEGEATAPIVPSLQAAYNWNNWSFQLNVAVNGGGGKCEFANGLGSFESNLALLPLLYGSQGITGYDADMYMKGRSYNIGFTLGAARKLNDNLSVYLGIRGLYGNNSYKGHLKNIQVKTSDGNYYTATQLKQKMIDGISQLEKAVSQCNEAASQYRSAGNETKAAEYEQQATNYTTQIESLTASAEKMAILEAATQDIVLDCDQYGWGFSPIIGIDYKVGNLNLAAKYEFKTKMRLENDAVNSEAANNLSALAKFKDGAKVADDTPALLTIGAQYEILKNLRMMAGYHLYFDKQATVYGDRQKLLDGNTTEYLLGMEWDICKHLQFSLGGVRTHYALSDDYMSDMSFWLSNWNLGTGFGINVTKDLKINLSYFQSFYEDYTKETNDYGNLSSLVKTLAGEDAANALLESGELKGKDVFERKNVSFGVSVCYKF